MREGVSLGAENPCSGVQQSVQGDRCPVVEQFYTHMVSRDVQAKDIEEIARLPGERLPGGSGQWPVRRWLSLVHVAA